MGPPFHPGAGASRGKTHDRRRGRGGQPRRVASLSHTSSSIFRYFVHAVREWANHDEVVEHEDQRQKANRGANCDADKAWDHFDEVRKIFRSTR